MTRPRYPIVSSRLLAEADARVPAAPGRGRPSYTAHRRAVSTAYYAVFHAVTYQVARTVFPAADDVVVNRIRRWIGHADIVTVARWVSQIDGVTGGSPPAHIRALLDPPGGPSQVDDDTALIAFGFLELNDMREQADYDHEAVFTRPDTLGHLTTARDTVSVVETTESAAAALFFGLVALQAKIQKR